MRTATLVAVLALAGCAGGELTDDLFPGNVPTDAEGRPSHLVVKVVDAETGEAIPGAKVAFVKEALYPIPEQPEAPVAEATAGDDGWVRASISELHDRYDWLYVSAEGYGPKGINATWLDQAVRLRKGVDVPFEIRDSLNRPVAGAQVDWHLGCGHTPAVRLVTTDAEGRGTLQGIDLESGEAWIKARGLRSDYLDLNWEPGKKPAVIHIEPAPVHSGRIVDENGTPVAGARVGAPMRHRGPWCASKADGTFELLGLERGESLEVARSATVATSAEGDPSPAGHGCTIQLPKPGEEQPGWKPGRKVRVKVVLEDGSVVTDCEVLFVHKGDGATTQRFIQPEGQALFGEPSTGDARFDLRPGEYDCVVEHSRGLILPLTVAVTVEGAMDDPAMEQVLKAVHAPLKKLEFDGVPKHATVWVATPGRLPWDLTDEAQAAGLIPLPAEGPAVLKLVADGHTQYVDLERGNEPQTVTWNGSPPVDPTKVTWEEPAKEMPELPDATLVVTANSELPLDGLTVTVDGDAYRGAKQPEGSAGGRTLTVQHQRAGAREVVITAPGCRAWRATVTLTKGRTSTVDVELPAASR